MTTLYLCDVENSQLYSLNGYRAKKITKDYPKWNEYEAGDDNLKAVELYFKKYGKLVADKNNLFVGFIA